MFRECGCDTESGTQDTDNNSPLTLHKSQEHIFRNDEDFYEIIPEGEEGSCFDNAKKKEKDTSRWKVHSKNDIEYSIFNIYNKKEIKLFLDYINVLSQFAFENMAICSYFCNNNKYCYWYFSI